MALTNATLVSGGSLAATGGTTTTFGVSGKPIVGGVELIDTAEADFRIRETIAVRSKSPVYDSSSQTYSKGKWFTTITKPYILASGATTYVIARVEYEIHPEVPTAIAQQVIDHASQVGFDTDFASFRATGALV